jgi:hypothetical protein
MLAAWMLAIFPPLPCRTDAALPIVAATILPAVMFPVTLASADTDSELADTFAESSMTTVFEPTENPSTLLNV